MQQYYNYIRLLFGMYWYPLEKLFDNSVLKGIGSALLGMFATPTEFALIIPLLWFVDLIAGLVHSMRVRKEKFNIDKIHLSFTKGVGYIFWLMVCTWFANTFDFAFVQDWAFGMVALTEIGSITRHVWGNKSKYVFRALRKTISAKVDAFDVLPEDEEKQDIQKD